MVFSKKYTWHGKNAAGQEFVGEADSHNACYADAAKQGSATCFIGVNPNFKLPLEEHSEITPPEISPEKAAAQALIDAAAIDAAGAHILLQQSVNAWREKALGLADLVVAGWNGLQVSGMILPEAQGEPDFVRQAKAMLLPPDEAALLDAQRKNESVEAI